MFEQTSRYIECEDVEFEKFNSTLDSDDKSTIKYKKRRFLPKGSKMHLLSEITIKMGDRLDNLSNTYFGDPEQFWRICDANDTLHPLELTEYPGKLIRIAFPW